jgi:hemerythrin-like domain-containing protein
MQSPSRTRSENDHASKNLKIHQLTRLTELVAQHQREEERLIAPIVDKYLDSNVSETLRREHGRTWEALQRLNAKLLEVNGSNDSQYVFLDSSAEFEAMLREEFSREENVIYWFASLCLSQSNLHSREKEVFENACQEKPENPSET